MTSPNLVRQQAYDTLNKYFADRSVPVGPATSDVAKLITLNSAIAKPKTIEEANPQPSVMSRIFDILSRPNYAVANFVDELVNDADPNSSALAEAWEGFTGRDKTTFSKVLEHSGMEEGFSRGALGFLLDVGLDPTTYIGAGAIKAGAKGLGIGKKVVAKPEQPLAQQLLNKGEPVHPESFGLPVKQQNNIPAAFQAPKIKPFAGKSKTQPQRVILPPSLFPSEQLSLPFPPLAGEAGLLRRQSGPGPQPKPEKVLGPQVPGQKSFDLRSYKKGSIFQSGDLGKIKEELNKGAFGASKIVDQVVEGNVDAVKNLIPKPLPILHPFGDRKLQEIADDLFTYRNPKFGQVTDVSRLDQANLWKQSKDAAEAIITSRKMAKAKVNDAIVDRAIKIYTAAERQFAENGYKFEHRLSDVIADLAGRGINISDDMVKEFGGRVKPGSEVWRSLQVASARSAIKEAPAVKNIVDKIAESSNTVRSTKPISDGAIFEFDKFLQGFARRSSKAADMSLAGQKATSSLIKTALMTTRGPMQFAIEQKAKIIDDMLAKGINNPELAGVVTKQLSKELGEIPRWAHNDNKAVESIMGRMATHYGQKDLRPLTLTRMASAIDTAHVRGTWLANTFKPFSDIDRSNAFRAAQGFDNATNPQVQGLANQIQRLMDNMTGKVTGQSIITRSAVHMDNINKWLRRYKTGFEFSVKAKHPLTEAPVDLSKGIDWLDSWKYHNLDGDPQQFLFKLQEAMEIASRERAVFDDLGERFGSKFKNKDFNTKVEGHPYLEGYYFPSDIAKQIPRFVKDWSIPAWEPNSQFWRFYDRGLSMWKAGVTIYRPGHHTRNMAGDFYLGWMDGVNSIKPYQLALRVIRSQRKLYEGSLNDVDRLIELGLAPKSMMTPKANSILFRNKSGHAFTTEQIWAVASQKGLLESAKTIEDIIDLGTGVVSKPSITRPFGGRIQQGARTVSELQQHTAKLAHFIDKVKKSRGSNLEDIFEQASRRSRKWHPTGLDLTEFERKVLRRVIPFYSWLRKSTPLLLEGLVMNPGKTVIPAKLQDAIQDAQGIDVNRDDPFPVDQMFPHWIRAQGLGPASPPEGLLSMVTSQNPEGYSMFGMGINPLSQLISEYDPTGPEGALKGLKSIGSGITPALKIPFELGVSGEKTFTGEPLTGLEARPEAMEQYIGEQIPIFSALQGITGTTLLGSDTKKASRSGENFDREAFFNWLTGLGVKGTGPYEKQAAFEKTAPAKLRNQLGREAYYANLMEGK